MTEFERRIKRIKQNPVDYELKLLRQLEEAVRNKWPVQPMLIGLERLRRIAPTAKPAS